MKAFIMGVAALVLFSPAAVADWDGYDYESGSYVAVEPGELVRSGRDIEFYDYGTGEYHQGTVEDINRSGSNVEVEIYDSTTDQYRTFEMEQE